jgi:hypothetical protein
MEIKAIIEDLPGTPRNLYAFFIALYRKPRPYANH